MHQKSVNKDYSDKNCDYSYSATYFQKMCGIYFCCVMDGCDELCDLDSCRKILARRGPDFTQEKTLQCGGFCLRLFSSVLWLQGDMMAEQPVLDEFENVLMWNGDIFEMKDCQPNSHESDTVLLSRLLSQASTPTEILNIMSAIKGPWAFVYFHKASNTVWFGRDFFGRQSLLISRSAGKLSLSSAVIRELSEYDEVPALGLYSCHLAGGVTGPLILHPWDCLQHSLDTELLTKFDCSISTESLTCPVSLQSNLSEVELNCEDSPSLFSELLLQPDIARLVTELKELLTQSVVTRVTHQPGLCKDCLALRPGPGVGCPHAATAVLFSGGLDSCVLASVAAEVLPPGQPLHLYNVAFQQAGGDYNVPDRLTGLQGYNELRALHPTRQISFIQVNVTLQELQELRAERIRDLLHPLNTVLDDSIGCAVWWAGRGTGLDLGTGETIQSRARVLLLGMGIDEQLGGYSRHRTAAQRHGASGLAAELIREISNISERNLGRDNRIVSDHGVAPRFPFLDENLVNFLSKVPINLKSDYKFGRGRGEKLILRLVAHQMGLLSTATEPKRAVQFGSRIAKMENRKEKGAQVAVR